MPSFKDIKESILIHAEGLGISKIGIASLDHAVPEKFLTGWLRRGYYADMLWMEKYQDKRIDPRLLMEGARTLLSVAVNYYNPSLTPPLKKGETGGFSRYVWGTDYHLALKAKLQALLNYIQTLVPGVEGRAFVDTGPILEKYWAQRAGIGWIGKNGNLITKEYGSWVFLGEIMLNIELEPDRPHKNHCGNCSRCIEACPTGAIVEAEEKSKVKSQKSKACDIQRADLEDQSNLKLKTQNSKLYCVDSNRCLSYWTIEYRGEEFPREIRENLQGRVYGCDICQEVCPWNLKFARPTLIPEFYPRQEIVSSSIEEIEGWTEIDYRRIFARSAVKRAKYSGLKRNLRMFRGE